MPAEQLEFPLHDARAHVATPPADFHGVTRRVIDWQHGAELHARYYTFGEIAALLGCSKRSVVRARERFDWPRRRAAR